MHQDENVGNSFKNTNYPFVLFFPSFLSQRISLIKITILKMTPHSPTLSLGVVEFLDLLQTIEKVFN